MAKPKSQMTEAELLEWAQEQIRKSAEANAKGMLRVHFHDDCVAAGLTPKMTDADVNAYIANPKFRLPVPELKPEPEPKPDETPEPKHRK